MYTYIRVHTESRVLVIVREGARARGAAESREPLQQLKMEVSKVGCLSAGEVNEVIDNFVLSIKNYGV